MMKHLALMALALLLAPGAALGADIEHQMPGHQPAPAAADFQKDYLKAMDRMHGPMMEGAKDAAPDAAFVRGMIPHHRGAVEMAEIELKYGKDPEIRKLAQEIIDDQKKEIEFMEEWLKRKK